MCPACVAAMGLYVAGGLSAGAGATFLATKLLRKPPASTAPTERFRKRMGWEFPWLSSHGTDCNYDFQATIDDKHPVYNYAPVASQRTSAGSTCC
jgi:predicted dithiol-disulfide oxidoreductase (DUF899 family)